MVEKKRSGFTIVELLIVIVVIAILAALTFVAFNGLQNRARVAQVSSGLTQAQKKLELYKVTNNGYPTSGNLSSAGVTDNDVTYQYTSDGTNYCITGTTGDVAYNLSSTTALAEGVCSGHTSPGSGGGSSVASGDPIQTVTSTNCPTSRTMVVDARDNHTYWVQKLADGKCWMLTNLAYAGGGTDTYGDTKTLVNGGSSSSNYTTPYYYVPPGANPTSGSTPPSTSTTGTGQYGYLYSFCAANGGQAGNGACSNSSSVPVDVNISVCPSGWRLPNGVPEFTDLNNAINGSSTTTEAGLRVAWLAQYAGSGGISFSQQGTKGNYWSSASISAGNGTELSHRYCRISRSNDE
jgi:uncharacterized protein (TIGR02145 family)/prepilin-type N-terminal cleavage/methylation domain-containing protein